MDTKTRNAVIVSASLKIERGFVLDSWVTLDYGDGSSQGFGGFALYLDKTSPHHAKESFAGHWIFRVMQIAGVEDWDRLGGRSVRVLVGADDTIIAIGHIVKQDWFEPAKDFHGS